MVLRHKFHSGDLTKEKLASKNRGGWPPSLRELQIHTRCFCGFFFLSPPFPATPLSTHLPYLFLSFPFILQLSESPHSYALSSVILSLSLSFSPHVPCFCIHLFSSSFFFLCFYSILFSLSNIISKHPRKLDMDVVQLWAAKSVLQQVFQEYPDLHRNVPKHFFKVSYSYMVYRCHIKEGRAGAQYICSCCGCTRVLGKRNMGRHNCQGVLEDHWDLALTRLQRCHFIPSSY